jgi:hypothetical protein
MVKVVFLLKSLHAANYFSLLDKITNSVTKITFFLNGGISKKKVLDHFYPFRSKMAIFWQGKQCMNNSHI